MSTTACPLTAQDTAAPAPLDDSAQFLQIRETILRQPSVQVPVDALVIGPGPRTTRPDPAYINTLAETEHELPPVLVHRSTMAVIDGVHRLRAARLRGEQSIAARFFTGSETEARILAVALNSRHGKALTPEDRHAAAHEIVAVRPHWSDRAIAAVTGISAKKIAEIRRQLPPPEGLMATRVGRDGRRRPVDPARRRRRAEELLQAHPQASLRWIAREAGVSPATVAAARDRLAQHHHRDSSQDMKHGQRVAQELVERAAMLRRDPSLRQNESGRRILRMIDTWAVFAREGEAIAQVLPEHCRRPVAEVMREYHRTLDHVIARFAPAE